MKNKRILCAVIAVFLLTVFFAGRVCATMTLSDEDKEAFSEGISGYLSDIQSMWDKEAEKWKDYSIDKQAFGELNSSPDSFNVPAAADEEIKSIISTLFPKDSADYYAECAVNDNDMCESAYTDVGGYILLYYPASGFSERYADSGFDYNVLRESISYLPRILIPIYGLVEDEERAVGYVELSPSVLYDYYQIETRSYARYKNGSRDEYVLYDLDKLMTFVKPFRENNDRIIILKPTYYNSRSTAVLVFSEDSAKVYDFFNSCGNPEYEYVDSRTLEFIEYDFDEYFSLLDAYEKKMLEETQQINGIEDLINAKYGGVADKTTGAAAGKKT
ncbi:MAG: hypothetical protein J5585_01390, partial [Clostridia bacterium]|nr:hypothetical protein [Clostridia bacterium]